MEIYWLRSIVSGVFTKIENNVIKDQLINGGMFKIQKIGYIHPGL